MYDRAAAGALCEYIYRSGILAAVAAIIIPVIPRNTIGGDPTVIDITAVVARIQIVVGSIVQAEMLIINVVIICISVRIVITVCDILVEIDRDRAAVIVDVQHRGAVALDLDGTGIGIGAVIGEVVAHLADGAGAVAAQPVVGGGSGVGGSDGSVGICSQVSPFHVSFAAQHFA